MYRVTQIKKLECVINAIKNGWLTRSVLITLIKLLFSLLILETIKYSKQTPEKRRQQNERKECN